MGSEAGVSDEKILALAEYATSPHYSEPERAALAYADAITYTDRDFTIEGLKELATPGQG